MNRLQFMMELRQRLQQLPPEELNNAVLYYSEYFDDAGPENEEKIAQDLGSPADVASQILSDYAIKTGGMPIQGTMPAVAAAAPVEKPKKSAGTIAMLCVLAVFAIPIGIPLIIAAAAVVFSLIVAVCAVLFSLYAVAFALIVAGLFTAGVSFAVLLQSPPTTIMFLGVGLLLVGIGLAMGVGMTALIKVTFQGIAALMRLIFRGKKNEKTY